jgi:hypothetical protein
LPAGDGDRVAGFGVSEQPRPPSRGKVTERKLIRYVVRVRRMPIDVAAPEGAIVAADLDDRLVVTAAIVDRDAVGEYRCTDDSTEAGSR